MGFQRHAYRRRSCIFGESDTHANTFSDPNRDSYADGNCDSNAKLNTETQSDSAAAPDSATSTLEARK